jgi:hypothetical protein
VTESVAERTGVCDCGAGVVESTPAPIFNLPGLSALAYRVGTHARFKQTMLAGLSRHAALRPLTTREDDDPTIALVDAWAAALDVLTFYQERLANEGYLLTAVEQRSIRELARAIGYELGPGVAADTRLAFELETAPGAPESAVLAVGTKVQSVPGQDELPQTFETVEEIEARQEWNALRVRRFDPVPPVGAAELYLKGNATNLHAGDRILLIARGGDWATHRLSTVREDLDANITRVAWKEEASSSGTLVLGPQTEALRVFALRVRASLFGHNAPDWTAMPTEVQTAYGGAGGADWPHITLEKVGARGGTNKNQVFLDGVYPDIVTGSWAVLRAPALVDALFEVVYTTEDQRTDFTMSAKTTRLDFGTDPNVTYRLGAFNSYLRETTVFARSEEIELAEWPVRRPVRGTSIELAEPVATLPEGRRLIVTGLPAYVTPGPDPPWLGYWINPGGGAFWLPAFEGEVFRVVGVAPAWGTLLAWHIDDGKGKSGTLYGGPDALVTVEPPDEAEPLIEAAVTGPPPVGAELQGTLELAGSLGHVYDPASVRIAANVARATHGEGRKEVVGGGDASVAFQRFALKDKPLTYTQSAGASGSASSLSVRVNGVLWHEVRAFYGLGARDRVYVVRIDDDGAAWVEFGDGATGARLTTAAQSVRALYRVGTGLAGEVGAGKLTQLLGAPLGVKAVTNPLPATGAEDPETIDRARENASLTVLTFERIVSLDDVEDFAAAFAGIGKAQATPLWDGETEIVHLTVALADETPPTPDSPTLANLRDAVVAKGDPHRRIQIDPYVDWPFAVEAAVVVDPDYEAAAVLAAVRAALTAEFSFERRAFAQSVAESEVIATIQRVGGVEGVDLQWLHLAGEYTLLPAQRARFSGGTIIPAQLLTLAPDQVKVVAA